MVAVFYCDLHLLAHPTLDNYFVFFAATFALAFTPALTPALALTLETPFVLAFFAAFVASITALTASLFLVFFERDVLFFVFVAALFAMMIVYANF
jgi:hypothetical protein